MGDELTVFKKFGNDENCRTMLGEGWWDLEQARVWAKGVRSTLVLPPLKRAYFVVELVVGSFLQPEIRPVQRLIVTRNGIELGSFKFSKEKNSPVSFFLSPEMIDDDGPTIIELYHPDHVVPDEVGFTDWRDLSICLFSLSLRETTAPARTRVENPFAEMESLGDSCEFGLVQRRSGVEPLGLFRFAGIKIPDLIRGLANRFDRIALTANMRLEAKAGGAELYVFEDLYKLNYHLFKDGSKLDFLNETKKQSARIRFLARKLVDEIASGEKLFVWCSLTESSESEITALTDALRAIGPSTLLWVTQDITGGKVGQATYTGEGLIRGYVDRFASAPSHISKISWHAWEATSVAAHKLWKEKMMTPPVKKQGS